MRAMRVIKAKDDEGDVGHRLHSVRGDMHGDSDLMHLSAVQ